MEQSTTYRTYFFILSLLLGTSLIMAQSSNIDWTAQSDLITVNGTDKQISSHLNKQGTSLVWEQIENQATNTITFAVTSVTGNWDSTNHLGQLIYGLSLSGGSAASLTVSGTNQGVTMTLTLNGIAMVNEDYIFAIDMATLTNL